jgi:hypothetical protein
MYMSLEQIATITDPTMKKMAEALFSMQTKAAADQQTVEAIKKSRINEYTAGRQQRIERICKRLLPGARDRLLAMVGSAGAQLSLGADGIVVDPIAPWLDIQEASLPDLPPLLVGQAGAFSIQPHPADPTIMSEDRISAVVEEQCRNTGLADKAAGAK